MPIPTNAPTFPGVHGSYHPGSNKHAPELDEVPRGAGADRPAATHTGRLLDSPKPDARPARHDGINGRSSHANGISRPARDPRVDGHRIHRDVERQPCAIGRRPPRHRGMHGVRLLPHDEREMLLVFDAGDHRVGPVVTDCRRDAMQAVRAHIHGIGSPPFTA
jgi:hypothetical protein